MSSDIASDQCYYIFYLFMYDIWAKKPTLILFDTLIYISPIADTLLVK